MIEIERNLVHRVYFQNVSYVFKSHGVAAPFPIALVSLIWVRVAVLTGDIVDISRFCRPECITVYTKVCVNMNVNWYTRTHACIASAVFLRLFFVFGFPARVIT